MFVMLLGSFTYAQTDGDNFDFSCIDYVQLRANRIADVEALGNTEVFALLAIQEDPAETTTIIFNKQLTTYVNTVYSHIERWEQSDYDTYLTDLEGKVYSQILRNERIVILEEAFALYSTATVSISLIDAYDGSGDAILFDGGAYSVDFKFNALIEDLPSTTLNTYYFQALWPVLIGNVQDELDRIAAAALVAANEANEAAYTAALDSNTATSTLNREIELEELSRDGIYIKVVFPYATGYTIEYHDANGLITLTDNDGDPDPQIFNFGTDLDSISDYDTAFNNAVTKIRDLVKDLINN